MLKWATRARRSPRSFIDADLPPVFASKSTMGLRGPRIESNKAISSVPSRIEHSFGFIEESLGGSVVRTVGTIRAKFNITRPSLVYNICRFGQIVRGTGRKAEKSGEVE